MGDYIYCPYCEKDVSEDKSNELSYELEDGDYTKTECEYCGKLFEIFVDIEYIKNFECSETDQPELKREIEDVKGQTFFSFSEKTDEQWTDLAKSSQKK